MESESSFDVMSFVALMEDAMGHPTSSTTSSPSTSMDEEDTVIENLEALLSTAAAPCDDGPTGPTDEDIQRMVEFADAFAEFSGAPTTSTYSTPTTTGKRAYNKKQKLSPDQKIPMYSVIEHNKVNITDPKLTDLFFENPELFSDDDVKRIKNVQFDTTQSGHAPARLACHTMKMIYLISETYNIPTKQLMTLCGSMESYKCQAPHTAKGEGRCTGTCSVGHFFCGRHKDDYTHQEGASMLKKRRFGF
jgi:hypothetical protein